MIQPAISHGRFIPDSACFFLQLALWNTFKCFSRAFYGWEIKERFGKTILPPLCLWSCVYVSGVPFISGQLTDSSHWMNIVIYSTEFMCYKHKSSFFFLYQKRRFILHDHISAFIIGKGGQQGIFLSQPPFFI